MKMTESMRMITYITIIYIMHCTSKIQGRREHPDIPAATPADPYCLGAWVCCTLEKDIPPCLIEAGVATKFPRVSE